MKRVVLVHGSVTGGQATWGGVLRELGDRWQFVVVERPGFPPGPPVERVDFERDAVQVADVLDDRATWSATRTAASSRCWSPHDDPLQWRR